MPQGLVKVVVERLDDGSLKLDVGNVVYRPDPDHRYVLRYRHSSFSDDHVVVKVDDMGFLKWISAVSKDETGEVALKFVELAAETAKIATLKSGAADELLPFKWEFACDPTDDEPIGQGDANCGDILRRLRRAPYYVDLEIGHRSLVGPGGGVESERPRLGCNEGACFRPALPYEIRFTYQDVADARPPEDSRVKLVQSRTIVVALPNEAPIMAVDLNRHAFVDAKTEVEFEDGMLSKVELEKPSEALGLVSLPVDAARLIASIPAALLDFKITSLQKNKNLLTEEANLIQSQMELLEKQRRLIEAQADALEKAGEDN
ncbi:MAG: hypothetical protein ABL957_09805 [Parvularculaceae bacterium]